MKKNLYFIFILFCGSYFSCSSNSTKLKLPAREWIKTASIYQLIPNKLSKEKVLARPEIIKSHVNKIGCNVVSLISFFPIEDGGNNFNPGNSYAAIAYNKANPNHGSFEQIKSFIDSLHLKNTRVLIELDMSITGPAHEWRKQYPEFYLSNEIMKNSQYNQDYIKLNFNNKSLQKEFLDILSYWFDKIDHDGYILHNTNAVPTEYLEKIIKACNSNASKVCIIDTDNEETRSIKQFHGILNRQLYALFDKMNVDSARSSDFIPLFQASNVSNFFYVNYCHSIAIDFKEQAMVLKFPNNYKTMQFLCRVMPGVPMLLIGEEEPIYERLNPFSPNPAPLISLYNADFLRLLNITRTFSPTTQCGVLKNQPKIVSSSEEVLCFSREYENAKDVYFINLKSDKRLFTINDDFLMYKEKFRGSDQSFHKNTDYTLFNHQFLYLSTRI